MYIETRFDFDIALCMSTYSPKHIVMHTSKSIFKNDNQKHPRQHMKESSTLKRKLWPTTF